MRQLGSCRVARVVRIGLACLLLFGASGCTSWFFQPLKDHVASPAEAGFAFDDVPLRTSDGVALHAWLIKPEAEPIGTVYFLHGNAENISTHSRAVYWLVAAGYEVLALDYRGYGRSQGRPDIPDVFEDIDAGMRWLITRDTLRPVFLLGQSLGASLAIDYLANRPGARRVVDGLIVEAAFTRYGTIGKELASRHWLTWAFQYPAKWLLQGQHDPLDAVPAISPIPLLLIHSRDDRLIEWRHGQQLFAAAGKPKTMLAASGPHIHAFADARIRQQTLSFMADISRRRSEGNSSSQLLSGSEPSHKSNCDTC